MCFHLSYLSIFYRYHLLPSKDNPKLHLPTSSNFQSNRRTSSGGYSLIETKVANNESGLDYLFAKLVNLAFFVGKN